MSVGSVIGAHSLNALQSLFETVKKGGGKMLHSLHNISNSTIKINSFPGDNKVDTKEKYLPLSAMHFSISVFPAKKERHSAIIIPVKELTPKTFNRLGSEKQVSQIVSQSIQENISQTSRKSPDDLLYGRPTKLDPLLLSALMNVKDGVEGLTGVKGKKGEEARQAIRQKLTAIMNLPDDRLIKSEIKELENNLRQLGAKIKGGYTQAFNTTFEVLKYRASQNVTGSQKRDAYINQYPLLSERIERAISTFKNKDLESANSCHHESKETAAASARKLNGYYKTFVGFKEAYHELINLRNIESKGSKVDVALYESILNQAQMLSKLDDLTQLEADFTAQLQAFHQLTQAVDESALYSVSSAYAEDDARSLGSLYDDNV